MNEIWRDLEGYEGLYQVSNCGRVRRFYKNAPLKVLKPASNKDGYLRVGLYKGGKRKFFKVHRLVALAFIPNPEDKPEVNHLNGVKSNNRADNLEWVTNSENQRHAFNNGSEQDEIEEG